MYLKTKVFEHELQAIHSDFIRELTRQMIEQLPDYFFEIPASSTGKYHPSYAIGSGGLVRHTKAAVGIAISLMSLHQCEFTDTEKDCIIAALICHDGFKSGKDHSKFTVFNHPLLAAQFVRDFKIDFTTPFFVASKISEEPEFLVPAKNLIAEAISSHMGQWTTSKYSKVVLPAPTTAIQKFVHECDYLASRKFLIYDDGTHYDPKDFEVMPNQAELQQGIADLMSFCRTLVTQGVDKQLIYKVVADHNNGRRNPNTITSMEVLNTIKQEVANLVG